MTDISAGAAILEAIKALCVASTAIIDLNKAMAGWMHEQSKDIAALRASAKGLDPTFSETYQQKRNEADTNSQFASVVAQLQGQVDEQTRLLGEIIQIIDGSQS